MTRRVVWLLLIGLLSMPGEVEALDTETDSSPGYHLGLRIGFDGHYKVGVWTPVEVTFDKGGVHAADKVVLTVPDGDGVPSRVSARFPDDGPTTTLYARFGRVKSNLTVEIYKDGQPDPIAKRLFETGSTTADTPGEHYPPAITATRQLIVSVGGDPLDMEAAVALSRQEPTRRPVVARLASARGLPDKWYGYEGVDTLLLCTSRLEVFAGLQPDGPRIAALDEWVRMGGKLVLCVGSRAKGVLSEGSPLAAFVPGRLNAMVSLRRTIALEEYASSSTAVPESADGERPTLRVPRLADVDGVIEAREGNLPLVIRTPRGFGQIIFLAADPDQPPLSEWKERPLLLHRLLDLPEAVGEEASDDARMMHRGYSDVSGQLRSALDQFSQVWRVPFAAIVVLIVLYILLLGPGDYFFLRKVARGTRWAWISFFTIVLGTCLAVYGMAHWLKGDRLLFNQLDLVDVDAASGLVRGTSWANVFRPPGESLKTLSLRPKLPNGMAAADARVLFAWQGLPGGGLGGMNPRASNPVLWREQYEFSPSLDAMRNVPIPVWATKSFNARWSAQTTGGVEAELTDDGQGASGTITNRLGFVLSECVLVYDGYAYMLKTLEPDKPLRIDAWLSRNELKTWLTQRRMETGISKGSYHAAARPYDQSSVAFLPSQSDPWPDIIRAMMFFDEAGGQGYTGLQNGYQRFVDFSDLLKTGRAILVAWAPPEHHGAELLRDGRPMEDRADKHATIYRFVFPVKTVER